MNSVKQLWDMQQLDKQQAEKQRNLKGNDLVEELYLIKNELSTGVEEFKKQKEDYSQLKLEINDLEEQVSALKIKVEHLNSKLNDETVSSHKEMAVIFEEVQLLQQKIADIETKELILIEKQEQLKTNLEYKSKYLKARKALYDQLKTDYQVFKQELQQQIQAIILDREKLVTSIADDPMRLYKELLKRYLNPVAVVKDGVCSGCHLKLNFFQKKQLKIEQEIIRRLKDRTFNLFSKG